MDPTATPPDPAAATPAAPAVVAVEPAASAAPAGTPPAIPPGVLRESNERARKAEQERDALREELASAWAATGATDDDIAVARTLHSRLPEATRPAFGAWFGGFRGAPTTAPRQLAHVWAPPPAAAPPVVTTAAPPPPAPAAPPPVLAASGAAPSSTGTAGAGGLEQQVVQSIIDTAKRTGDWSEYEKHRAGILAGIARRAW